MTDSMDITFHYPPELFALLVEAIPALNRAKNGVLLFFQGAGVPGSIFADISEKLKANPNDLNKFEITRTVLTRLNEKVKAPCGSDVRFFVGSRSFPILMCVGRTINSKPKALWPPSVT